jgi:hypothetical protein
MKTRIVFLIYCLLISAFSFSQNEKIENTTENFLQDLKQQKVDTICTFEDYSVGSVHIYKSDEESDYCDFEFENIPTYIMWKKNSKTFLTKKDSCFEYSTAEINPEQIWKKYFENKTIIKVEQVKNFQFVEMENGKKNILTSMVDHSHHQNFKFIINDKIIEKKFDDFDLQKKENNNNNINYKHNINLKSKKLIDEISNVIEINKNLLSRKRK